MLIISIQIKQYKILLFYVFNIKFHYSIVLIIFKKRLLISTWQTSATGILNYNKSPF